MTRPGTLANFRTGHYHPAQDSLNDSYHEKEGLKEASIPDPVNLDDNPQGQEYPQYQSGRPSKIPASKGNPGTGSIGYAVDKKEEQSGQQE